MENSEVVDFRFYEQPKTPDNNPVQMTVVGLVNKVRFGIIDTHGESKSFYMDTADFKKLISVGKDW